MIPSAAANYKPHPWDLRGDGGADIIEGKGGDWMDLTSPVTALPGIGSARAAALKRLNIETVYDLITDFPRT